jgi:hypothetical protein
MWKQPATDVDPIHFEKFIVGLDRRELKYLIESGFNPGRLGIIKYIGHRELRSGRLQVGLTSTPLLIYILD